MMCLHFKLDMLYILLYSTQPSSHKQGSHLLSIKHMHTCESFLMLTHQMFEHLHAITLLILLSKDIGIHQYLSLGLVGLELVMITWKTSISYISMVPYCMAQEQLATCYNYYSCSQMDWNHLLQALIEHFKVLAKTKGIGCPYPSKL